MALYVVTGVLVNGRRLKAIRTNNWMHANGINLWKGSIWQIDGGKRKLVKRVGW